jgi:DNA-binding XRE family transcriptional regulator
MPPEPPQQAEPPAGSPAGPGRDEDRPATIVSPVVVLTRSFAARPSSLPDAEVFVKRALAGTSAEDEARSIHVAIMDAILAAARPGVGTFQIAIRVFPDDAEVEILCEAPEKDPPPALLDAGDGSFAAWLTDALRREGLSQEAAARQLGVSVRTVSRWVRGQTEPRLRELRRIQELFGQPPLP